MERRTGIDRRIDSDSCPLNPECAKKLIKGHEVLLDRVQAIEIRFKTVDKMERQIEAIHNRFIHAKGFLAGMRMGAASVFVLIVSFVIMLYGVLSGKISIKDLIASLF